MKLGINLLKNKNQSLRFFAGGIFIVMAFLFLNSKGQFGRFSFWGSHTTADSTAPTCTINTQQSGWITVNHADYTFTCTDDVGISRVECNFKATGWFTCDSNTAHSFTGLANTATNSTNWVQFRAFDTSGNMSSIATSGSFGVDLDGPNAPSLTITGTDTSTFHISVSATDVGSSGLTGFYYASYDQGIPSYGLAFTTDFSNNLVGTVYFRIYATDAAGNNGAVSVVSWSNGGWTAWSACDGNCGTGGGTQTRTCTNPAPSTNPAGIPCSGSTSQSCNQGSSGDNSTDMCAGGKYYVRYKNSYCPTDPCPGTKTSNYNGYYGYDNSWLCSAPWSANSINCNGTMYPNGTTVSCNSGSATITYSQVCFVQDKTDYYSVYECTCN